MAAGLGFKTFTTGEVLTAADTNGYLMQGINVFASTAARDAAITSPQEGQFAFTKDTNGLWYYDGAAWVASGATGDIEGVTAGVGITGGGTSGTVTITNDMATTITASGDIVVGTGSGTYDNLPIGTTGQILTADTTVSPYKVKWATAGAAAKSYSLLNAGGTALTGAATITVSGISGISDLMCVIVGASLNASSNDVTMRINTDSGNNYQFAGPQIIGGSGYDKNNFMSTNANYTSLIRLGAIGSDAGQVVNAAVSISGGNSSGVKAFMSMGGSNNTPGNTGYSYWVGGVWNNSATISSISLFSNTNYDAGTIYIYGAA